MAAPLPADAATGASADSFLKSVDCPSDGNCVGAGFYDNNAGGEIALIDTLSGGVWTASIPSLPADAATGSNAVSEFKDVSCANTGVCTAVGTYDNSSGTPEGLIESLNGGTWTPLSVSSPATSLDGFEITSVSCPADNNCAATGYYEPTSGHDVSALLAESGGSWTTVTAPTPANAGTVADLDNDVAAVSCAATTCEAGGSYNNSAGDSIGLLEHLSGGVWSAVETPLPANGATSGTTEHAEIESLSCTADGACTGVGDYGDATTGNNRALIESLTNGIPTASEGPLPANAVTSGTDLFAGLTDVSCVVGGVCTATGAYATNSASNPEVAMIDTEVNGTWSTLQVPLPAGSATGASEFSQLSLVSCTTRGTCVASGRYDDTGSIEQGMFDTFTPSEGYWEVAGDGGIFTFGSAVFHGSTGALHLNKPIVGMAALPGGGGYWLVASDGGIFTFGTASFFGSTGAIHLNKPIVGMAATPDGQGYWLVASDGGIFSFGDAQFYGSTGAITLNKPIVGMAASPDGLGYWLVASDGGIFSFGSAKFHGSTGAIELNKPIVGMAASPSGLGYWLVASDGGIFTFGDAQFYGSTGAVHLNKPIVGLLSTFDGQGYWLVASDGGIFTFGDAAFLGSEGGTALNSPIVNGAPS
jgi:hypothetical protein